MPLKKKAWTKDKPFWFVLGLAVLVGVGLADYLAGSTLSLTLFYLVPILLLSWYVGFWAGVLAVLLSGLDWFVQGHLLGVEETFPAVWNAVLEIGLFLVVIYLATTLRKALDREKGYARTDHQTGALNARAFEELAGQEIRRCRRSERPLTAAYLDVDDFKEVNDRFGHAVGDQVLKCIVETVGRNIRSSDILARVGGDEFAVLLPECGEESAPPVLMRLRERLRDAMKSAGWPVTLSIGAITFARPPATFDEILKQTDVLMYESKRAGKDQFRHEVVRGPAAGRRERQP
jgi:diguanylate cyclase (GGDEF)-like protein